MEIILIIYHFAFIRALLLFLLRPIPGDYSPATLALLLFKLLTLTLLWGKVQRSFHHRSPATTNVHVVFGVSWLSPPVYTTIFGRVSARDAIPRPGRESGGAGRYGFCLRVPAAPPRVRVRLDGAVWLALGLSRPLLVSGLSQIVQDCDPRLPSPRLHHVIVRVPSFPANHGI